ncbi:T-complex protein 1 subunit zeta-2 [Frankliniella fusca]|uniref:T-complex protein 1 subunit zeta-2 n=1 Tax=Frankliniella fusca TaxID=407009 RepID=A0AAE1H7Q5_9NEOP|nr:T-complex protein 1 subunit zeta-2 [Frankliniella fusca]
MATGVAWAGCTGNLSVYECRTLGSERISFAHLCVNECSLTWKCTNVCEWIFVHFQVCETGISPCLSQVYE